MFKQLIYFNLLFSFFILSSCSTNNELITEEIKESRKPEILYKEANVYLEDMNYLKALENFNEISDKFPLSNEGVQSQLMIAFINYLELDYDSAIFKLKRFVNKYPSHKNADYAYYLLSLCYYEQINNEFFDGQNNELALKYFNQVLNRFPNSDYSKDSQQKKILINENISAKHMNIANFYLNSKKYIAAMNRYKLIVEDHSSSKFVPEALYRLVEIYYSLGLVEDAIKTASLLGYNYPDSRWYKYSYDLLNIETNIDKKDKKLINKIRKIFGKDEEKEKI